MSQQINLYNPLFLKQEKHFSARTMVQALGVIALGLGGLYGYALFESHAGERAARQYAQQLAAQRDQLVKLTARVAAQGKSKALETDVARLETEVKTRQATLDALGTGELGNTAGFSDFLAAFARQAVPEVWLTGIRIGDSGNELIVQGRTLRAELVPTYLNALNREPMMRGRRVTEMKLAAKTIAPPPPGKAAAAKAPPPQRFVEFTVSAPLRVSDAASKGAKP